MAKKQEECPRGVPAWVVTYSDLVTLLLTFFVLLLSMASMDPVKFVQAKSSIRDSFGWRTTAAPKKFSIPVIQSPPESKFTPIPRETKLTYFKKVKNDLELTKLMDQVEAVQRDDDSIVLRINDSILFDKGKTNLNPSSYPLLRKIADIIRPLPMTMRIEGHTDNTPTTLAATTNWDISVARAVSVMRFYNQGQIFSIDRMAAVGYGATEPLQPNTTDANRAKNRRVEFILNSNRKVDRYNRPTSRIPF